MITWLLFNLKGKEFTLCLYFSIFYFILCFFIHKFFGGLVLYIFVFICLSFSTIFVLKRKYRFWLFFGLPGSGKTTISTSLAIPVIKKSCNSSRKVYSNFDLVGSTKISKSDLSINNPLLHDCDIHIDEAGLDFDNRNFAKNFTKDCLELLKYHRKLHINFYFYSQEVDVDIKIRSLCNGLFLVKNSFLPYFVKYTKIGTKVAVDKQTKQLIKAYYFIPFSSHYVYMPSTWKFFDTDKY